MYYFSVALIVTVVLASHHVSTTQASVTNARRTREVGDPDMYVPDYYPPGQVAVPMNFPKYRYQYRADERTLRPLDEEYIRPEEYQQYPTEYPTRLSNQVLENLLVDYLEENPGQKDESSPGINKRILSSFRERMEKEKSKENNEKLTEIFLQKLHEIEDREMDKDYNKDYIEMIEDLWEKYRNAHKETPMYVEEMKKRQFPVDYSTLGWSGVGYRKRASSSDSDDSNDGLYFLKYPVYDEEGNTKNRYDWTKPSHMDHTLQRTDSYRQYPQDYLYANRKPYSVTKRSSNFYQSIKPVHHKRGVGRDFYKKVTKIDNASGTDPKVVKDLSNIFGKKVSKIDNTTFPNSKPNKNGKIVGKKPDENAITSLPLTKTTVLPVTESISHKEADQSVNAQIHEPLNIKKKSIDWSNYFGIDRRRKKSESYNNDNEIDNNWLINRYNKAVAMAVKRNSEYPLTFFRNHDISDIPSNEDGKRNKDTKAADETKLGDVDDKLKNIEDLIIDEALKYTGAHEGETDPKKVQEVKDKVISRLAAAYSLEKMRRALSEFKSSLEAQKYAMTNKEADASHESEGISVKKKSSEVEKKCASKTGCENIDYGQAGNEIDAEEYPITADLVSSGLDKCDAIENRCRRLVATGHSALYYPICEWHQLCYLCGVDDGSSEEVTACDVIFLSRADALCQADIVCQWAARPALKFLRDLHENSPKELATQCKSNTCDVSAYSVRR